MCGGVVGVEYVIRKEKTEDQSKIRALHITAFTNGKNEANLVEAIRSSEGFIPELSLVAITENDQVIGHILFTKISIETTNEIVNTLALAPMAVDPHFQQKGIGSQLVQAGITACRELGFEHIIVLGHPQFYPKFGFKPANLFGITPPFPVPDEVFMALELNENTLQNISGKVAYPPSFDSVT